MFILNRLVGALPPSFLSAVSGLQFRHAWLRRVIQAGANIMRGRDGVIQQGPGRGLHFNTTANLGYLLGTSEPDVQASLVTLVTPGMVCYDIGANVGFMAMLAARLAGPVGHVICFEPLESNVQQILHNAELNGFSHVQVRAVALANDEGTVRFAVSSTSTLGRIADTNEAKLPAGNQGFISVPVHRLDDIVALEQIPPPGLIKMDVEGAETDVLAGAGRILRENRPFLLIELHGTNDPVYRILTDAGYRVCVLGDPGPVVGAHWNSHIVGIPSERPDLEALVAGLVQPPGGDILRSGTTN